MQLIDLIDIKKWQEIQDIFSYVSGIGLRTIDPKGTPLTEYSGEPAFCRKFIRNNRNKYNICRTCMPTFLGGDAVVDKNLSFVCPPGLHNFVIPLGIEQAQNLGYVIMGPVILVSRRPKDYYVRIAEELNVGPESLWEALLEIRVFSLQRLQAMVELVRDFSSFILKLARTKQAVEEAFKELTDEESGELMSLFDKFLNMALQVSGADIGSIMMMNSANELTIRAARGLDESVVRSTRVRVGEGICGTAISQNTPFLINESYADSRIRPYLNRPQLKSSMVLPIKINDKPMGVMNLGTLQNSPIRFNSDNIMSMSSLVELAGLAFTTPKN